MNFKQAQWNQFFYIFIIRIRFQNRKNFSKDFGGHEDIGKICEGETVKKVDYLSG